MVLFLLNFCFAQTVYIKVQEENFREKPNGEKIGTLLKGTELKQIGSDGEWVKVTVEGWIYKPSVSSEKPTAISITKKYRTVMWAANIYSNAGTKRYGNGNSRKIGSVKKGEKLEILDEKQLSAKGITVPWYYIKRSNGQKGWISDADLTLE